jgi:hypothetical protein
VSLKEKFIISDEYIILKNEYKDNPLILYLMGKADKSKKSIKLLEEGLTNFGVP